MIYSDRFIDFPAYSTHSSRCLLHKPHEERQRIPAYAVALPYRASVYLRKHSASTSNSTALTLVLSRTRARCGWSEQELRA